MCLGGGDAWKQDHEEILAHARGLHYDHVPGVTLPSADAPRQEWISAMNAFNAWKARERAKEASGQAWWQTYRSDSGGDSGGGGSGGGGGGGGGGSGPPDWDNPDPPSGTGPYPDDNIYFPMLVPYYEAPKAQDWGRFMPRGQQGANVRPGDIWSGAPDLSGGPIHGGLLYQPWTSNYQHHFVPDSLWDYRPPELKVGRPKFYQNPLGILEVVHHEEESSNGNGSNTDDDLENRGGKGPGDIGYTPDDSLAQANLTLGEMIAHVVDVMQGGQGVTGGDMAGWGDPGGGASVGGSGGSSGVGPGGVGGGVGKGY